MPCLNGEHLRAADLFRPDSIAERKSLHFSALLDTSAKEQLLITASPSMAGCTGRELRALARKTRGTALRNLPTVDPISVPKPGWTQNFQRNERQQLQKLQLASGTCGTKIISLSIPNLIHLQSSFPTFPSVFSQASFPEWELLPHKVCWNCASFCISLCNLTFLQTSTKQPAVARQILSGPIYRLHYNK